MKKQTFYLCAGILALTLTACGKAGTEESASQSGESSVSSGASTEEGGSETDPTEGNPSEESTPTDSQPQGDSGASGEDSQGWSEEMTAVRGAVVDALGADHYWPDMAMDPEMLEVFYGISSDMYEDYMAESPMISANVDTLVVIRAKEGQADTVETALNAYRDNLVNDTMQYPQNLGKIQASQVERIGDYVVFVQLGGDAIDSEEEEEVISKCEEANSQALDAIRGIVEK